MNILEEKYHGKKIDFLDVVNIVEASRFLSGKECVVVTGVTGQDGSHMVDYLMANTDYHIVGCVRRLNLYQDSNVPRYKSDRFQLAYFDLSDCSMISLIIEKIRPKYFINLAAQSFVGSSWDFALKTWDVNSTAVLNILEAIRLYHPTCRYFQAGSSEEFGSVSFVPQDELHPLRPRSPYGASKVASRHLINIWRESYGLYAIQGWLYNHEGVRRGEEFVTRKITKGVARISRAIYDGESFAELQLGNLDAKRDWSSAEDIVEGIWLMLNYAKPVDLVLASGVAHSIREFVEIAFESAGISGSWSGSGTSEVYRAQNDGKVLVSVNAKFYRKLDVDVLVGNATKARTEISWRPKVSFTELVRKMVAQDLAEVGLSA